MKKSNFLVLLFVSSILIMMFSSLNVVSAYPVVLYSYPNGASGSLGMNAVYPSVDGTCSGIACHFTTSNYGYLDSVYVKLWVSGASPMAFNISYKITTVNHVGVDGDEPSDTVLAVGADLLNEFTVTSVNPSWQSFNLTFAQEPLLENGEEYFLVFTADSFNGFPQNVGVCSNAVSGDDDNKMFWNSHWDAVGNVRFFLVVNGNSEPTVTSTPSPSPSPYVHVDAGLDAVPSYYMIILVLFAVVAVLAGIYVGFERDGGNKGVAFLFALVALVIFVVLIVGYLAG